MTESSPFALDVAERAPLSVVVSRQLRERILSGDIPVGTELPSEKELTQRLGVSRSTVREAVRILQGQGLLTGGATVSTQRPRVTSELIEGSAALAMQSALRLGRVPLSDLLDLRILVEGEALERAASERDPAALAEAAEALEAMQQPDVDIETFRAADLRFHRCLIGASGNAAYPLLMGVLRGAMAAHLGEALHAVDDPRATMEALTAEHAEILAAVARGHGRRARALVAEHIRTFYEARIEP